MAARKNCPESAAGIKQYYAQENAGHHLTTDEQQGYTTICSYCGANVPEVFVIAMPAVRCSPDP